jgi:hypothetical protein
MSGWLFCEVEECQNPGRVVLGTLEPTEPDGNVERDRIHPIDQTKERRVLCYAHALRRLQAESAAESDGHFWVRKEQNG